MYGYEKRKLSFQLVPSTCWYINLRSIIPNWTEISNKIRQSNKCDICGSQLGPFDAHEVWKYNDSIHIQTLDKIICVCKNCHNTIHIGHAQLEGTAEQAYNWYKNVNNVSDEQLEEDLIEAFDIWDFRSNFNWVLDKNGLIERTEQITGISCNIDTPVNNRYYANVQYSDKEIAKQYGARWDNIRKLWYFLSEEARNKYINRGVSNND